MQRSRGKSGGPEWYFVDESQPTRESWFSRNRFMCRVCVFLSILAVLLIVMYFKMVAPTSQVYSTEFVAEGSQAVIPNRTTQLPQLPPRKVGERTEFSDEEIAGPIVQSKSDEQQQ
eukprot:TRINITY_DN12500_c0_g1_i1.p5 TRINITY_DN12500_c0_g1~~TRINITY_DN12500_c0_g1_i1.p5  ORF type:complete len:116 (-),score=19.35 TRINITY_DN12500_c0_g1_i1:356-703(-)